MRIIAIDWSGAKRGARRKIWLAEAGPMGLVRLESGRSREETADWLVSEMASGTPMVVGLDFAFSLPAEALGQLRYPSAMALWADLDGGLAEDWLKRCEPPFWGRPGRKRPSTAHATLRATELDVAGSIKPKSVFQIGGAGAVGTGSLRGMPALHRLHTAGFSVWPFTPAGKFTLVEIYPRVLTGPVNKSNQNERERYLAQHCSELDAGIRKLTSSSEDAFDAAVSALVMWTRRDELASLPAASGTRELVEGAIWRPRVRRTAEDYEAG